MDCRDDLLIWHEIPELDARADARMFSLSRIWSRKERDPRSIAKECGVFQGFSDLEIERFANSSGWPGYFMESIAKNGIDTPLVMYDDFLEGNHRLAAALFLKMESVPVYVAKF